MSPSKVLTADLLSTIYAFLNGQLPEEIASEIEAIIEGDASFKAYVEGVRLFIEEDQLSLEEIKIDAKEAWSNILAKRQNRD